MKFFSCKKQIDMASATLIALALLAAGHVAAAAQPSPPSATPLEFGVDRSNMGTEWTLAFPQEPNVAPFLAADYNKPGDSEARRVAVMNGIARIHAGWFRDGLNGSPLSIDLLKLVHARGMKMLAILGPVNADFPPGAHLDKAQSGCTWGTYPLSKINLQAYKQRIETGFAALRAAGMAPDAFEVGNELDLYCNDADNPTPLAWAQHHFQWFLNADQVQNFVRGYAPFLAVSVAAIRAYFPHVPIITYGSSMPATAPLIQALANVRGPDGKVSDYTQLVDGYGAHLYPNATTTAGMVDEATAALRYEAAHYPHMNEKSIWVTEWNPAGSSFWNGQPWYFQYNAQGQPGGVLNKADTNGRYPAMTAAAATSVFNNDVVRALRNAAAGSVNISHVFYYSYDSGHKSSKCDHVRYAAAPQLDGYCIDGLIDPFTGNLFPGMAAAVSGATN